MAIGGSAETVCGRGRSSKEKMVILEGEEITNHFSKNKLNASINIADNAVKGASQEEKIEGEQGGRVETAKSFQ
eukprot:15367179-Ditylum_brightwellii.AAC.2